MNTKRATKQKVEVTTQQAADILGVSTRTFRRYKADCNLPTPSSRRHPETRENVYPKAEIEGLKKALQNRGSTTDD